MSGIKRLKLTRLDQKDYDVSWPLKKKMHGKGYYT
jgi:hypothetical protein